MHALLSCVHVGDRGCFCFGHCTLFLAHFSYNAKETYAHGNNIPILMAEAAPALSQKEPACTFSQLSLKCNLFATLSCSCWKNKLAPNIFHWVQNKQNRSKSQHLGEKQNKTKQKKETSSTTKFILRSSSCSACTKMSWHCCFSTFTLRFKCCAKY